MSDPIRSVNPNNSSVNNSSQNQPESTGVPLADALVEGIQHAMGDRSLAQRLASENKVGNFTLEQNPVLSNHVSAQIPKEAIGLSSPALAPDQITAFANAVQIPQAWSEVKSEISPLHEKYLSDRNPLADSVMSNEISTLLALILTPPLGVAAWMKHKSSQEALQQVSEKQVKFLVEAIKGDASNPSGNLKQVLINTAQSLDVLNGLSLDTASQVAASGSLAAPALKLAIGLFRAVDKSDPTVTSSDRTITGTDIVAMKELLYESIALLAKPDKEINSEINNSGSGVAALKVFVEAMLDMPAHIEEKYSKLHDPLEKFGVPKPKLDEAAGFLKNIGKRVNNLFRTGADQAAEIVNKNASAAQVKTTAGLLELANKISTSSEAQQVVSDAGDGLRQVAPLVGQITQTAAATLQDQLKSIGIAAEQMSRANKPN